MRLSRKARPPTRVSLSRRPRRSSASPASVRISRASATTGRAAGSSSACAGPKATRSSHYLDDAEAVIGLAARRPIAAGSPFRAIDLARPVLIKRGASVTVVLEAQGLRLTQTGVARASGSEGDLITIRNVNSDRDIKAAVIGENLARAPFRAGATTIASAE
jgi:flagella basal body P-ring formation protein FlgA